MRFLMSGFLHESIVPIPLSNILEYFRKYFRFQGDILENIFDFWVTIPGCQKNDPQLTPIFFTSNHKPRHVGTQQP